MPRKKVCIICNKEHQNTLSKTCGKLCQRKHQANLNKANKEKIKIKKENAYSKILIRLSWVDEEDREEIRGIVTDKIWPFVKKRQITIKVSRGKTKSDLQKLEDKADDLWSIAVRLNYNNKCAYSWETEYLNAHHIESRTHRATRWDLDNGICLSSNHHTYSSVFSAHKTPEKFAIWLRETKWDDFVDNLHKKSRQVVKVTPDFIKEQIQILEDFISKNKD